MIVATAGHVDHGKTSLIKALTGVDTDRLPEEKRRGMSIDLGFAYLRTEDGATLAFVDVPGHERFIRNMIAGVTGIDMALIVVAADDGPMPQTLEHIRILDLLGVRSAAVALTKTDLVSAERLQQAQREIEACLEPTALRGAPVFPVSARTDAGIAPLKRHLSAAARSLGPKAAQRALRMNVDRAFSLKGIGLVVTGTIVSGAVRIGDEVLLMPGERAARVRGIHADNLEGEVALQGQRCALNLAGLALDAEQAGRGHAIVAPGHYELSRSVDVEATLVADATTRLRLPMPVTVFAGTRSALATLHALDKGKRNDKEEKNDKDDRDTGDARNDKRTPQADAPFAARVTFQQDMLCFAGERLLFRDPGSGRLAGGAVVLDPLPPARGRGEPQRIAWLAQLRPEDAAATFDNLLHTDAGFVDLDWLSRAFHLTAAERAALCDGKSLRMLAAGGRALAVDAARWSDFLDGIAAQVAAFHAEQPEAVGMKAADLARTYRLPARDALADVIDELVAAGRLERVRACLRAPGYRPILSGQERSLLEKIRPLLAGDGCRPRRVIELAEALGADRHALEAALTRIARSEAIFQVAKNRFFLPETLNALAAVAQALAQEQPDGSFDAAAFRDRSGLGRNLTIQVLEFFDAAGLCRREGESRRLLKPAEQFFTGQALVESINGRDTFPVERTGFKPDGGCSASLGSSTLSSSAPE